MFSQTDILNTIERRLPKVIDARTHGVVDYCHSAFFFGVALFCRKSNPRAAAAAAVTGTFVLVQSLLTDYPLGAGPVLSFQTHGRMDAGFAASSLAIPRVFAFDKTPAAKIFKMNAFVESTVVGLTDFDSQRARDQKQAA